jgi:hypothetical protein
VGNEEKQEDLHPNVLVPITLGVQFHFGVVEVHTSEVG